MERLERSLQHAARARATSQGNATPSVVQQLMFNRILASVRLLAIDHVTVTRFDAGTGTIEGSLAGVNFVVSVSPEATRATARSDRGGPPAAPSALRGNSGASAQESNRVLKVAGRGRDAEAAVAETSDDALVLLNRADKAKVATPRALRLLASRGAKLNQVPHVEQPLVRTVKPTLPLCERQPFGLTDRERQILALVAEGRTNGQVASALRISPLTVGKHLEHVYTKLGVINRTAAVHTAREQRIIPL